MPLSRLAAPPLALVIAATSFAFTPAAPDGEPDARVATQTATQTATRKATQRPAFPGAKGFGAGTPAAAAGSSW